MQPQSHASASTRSAPSDPLFNVAVPVALKSLIDRYGVTLTGEASRLRGLLQDECPQAKKEISVLLQALEQRVPQDLLRVHSGEPIQSLSSRLAKRLSDEKAMSPAASRWAVQAWAFGMGVESALFGDAVAADPSFDDAGSIAPITAANEPLIDSVIAPVPPLQDKRVRNGLIGAAVALIVALAWWMLTPMLEITRIETDGPFIGNGKATPVFVEFDARNVVPRTVEVRFIRGDGTWEPATWKRELGAANGGTRVGAGSLQYRTKRAMSATFEYVLVSADGKRSAPFERTFDIAPPITITSIRVPRPLRVGREFALTIGYEKGAADIVKIERRVVETSVPWAQSESSQQVKLSGDSGNFDYRFDAVSVPMRSTLEFVAVDAQGVRSEPARVLLDIGNTTPPVASAAGLGTVTAVSSVTEKGQGTGIGAVIGGVIGGVLGNRFGGGHGREVTTVAGVAGGAYAGHEAEKNIRGTSTWNTTVRFDNGSTRVIRTTGAPRWRSGERVSFVNGVLSPAP